MKLLFWFFIIICISFSCAKRQADFNFDVPNYSFLKSEKNVLLHLDSVEIDLSPTSSIGEFRIINNQLVFLDKEFASAYLFDKDFKIIDRKLGFGKGPNEIFGINWITVAPDSSIIIFDTNGFIYSINKHWEVTNRCRFEGYYSPKWKVHFWTEYNGKSIKSLHSGKLLIPVTAEEKKMNPYGFFNASDLYYKVCPALGEVDVPSGKTKSVMASRPPIYSRKENSYLAMFNFMDFVVKDNSYLLSWAVDSLIYTYRYPDALIYTFGCSGKDMNTKYIPYKNIEDAQANIATDFERFGYYTQLTYDKESERLFRCYYKGNGVGNGLQIYQDTVLLTDLAVPRNFYFIGKLNGYYLGSCLPDESAEKITLYQFKLSGL